MRLVDFTSSSHARELQYDNGTRVLFSYGIPVAAYIPGIGPVGTYIRTNRTHSKTTSRHVTEWLGSGCRSVPQVDQATLDSIGEP